MNHLHLNVPDVAKARRFYESFFGFSVAFQHGDGIFMRDAQGFLLAIDALAAGE